MGQVRPFRGAGHRPVAVEARCPHCGGGIPWDCNGDLSTVCLCGLDWADAAPFPKSTLTREEWEHVRTLVLIRCGGRCEITGDRLRGGQWSVHHRRARGMGGTDRPDVHSLANLLAVTGDGTRGVHGWVESHRDAARAMGWLVDHSGPEPDAVPLVLYSGRRVLLDPVNALYLPPPGDPYHLGPMPEVAA